MKKPRKIAVGRQILDIVTTGMYNNPLMVLREYVQNAADSIDAAIRRGVRTRKTARIEIILDAPSRRLTIRDNGMGVPHSQALDLLCGLGLSTKAQESSRGFRGIGRLGGLGYCDTLRFETRSPNARKVSIVVWHGDKLRSFFGESKSRRDALAEVVKKCVTTSVRSACKDDPDSFFCVTLDKIARFHKDELTNVSDIRGYLSRVAPVPFATSFPYSQQIYRHLREVPAYRTYSLSFNGQQVLRPHDMRVPLNGQQEDAISGIETVVFYDREQTKEIGRGWYATTNHLASIPASVDMRGVRVRQGNIEIGDEYFLAEAFSERRFAAWHIGEIHLCYDLKANARRDGFEHNPEHEAFLEQSSLLGAHLSRLCRRSSEQRSNGQRIERVRERLRRIGEIPLVVNDDQLTELHEEKNGLRNQLVELGDKIPRKNKRMQPLLLSDVLDGRCLRSVSKKELLVDVSRRLVEELDDLCAASRILAKVLEPYLNHSIRKRLTPESS